MPMICRAQVVVQDDSVRTDTIDLFTKSDVHEKSGLLAMGASLVLPGLGQQYFGQDKRALAYFSAEALFLFGAIFCDHYSRQLTTSAHSYAWLHANVTGGTGANDVFWGNVATYNESDGLNQSASSGYNQQMELINRDQSQNILVPNLQWRWDDPANRLSYDNQLNQAKAFEVASSFFIGAMVLDRLVSFVDARFSAHHQSSSLSTTHVFPTYDAAKQSSGLCLQTGL